MPPCLDETVSVSFESMHCITCGVMFALPEPVLRDRQRLGLDVSCPNGHITTWTSREELAQEIADRETDERIKRVEERCERMRIAKHYADCDHCGRRFLRRGLRRHLRYCERRKAANNGNDAHG